MRIDFAKEIKMAQSILSDQPGTVRLSKYDHEVARYVEPGLTLIFYPHRTTAGNYHLRVRPSVYTKRALDLCAMLADEAGHNCTFQFRWPTKDGKQTLSGDWMLKIHRSRLRIDKPAGGEG